MREFNDFEKAVITAFVEARGSNDILHLCAANHIMNTTDCYAIEWITEVGWERVVFYCKDKNASSSVVFGALDVLSLLKYLEENGYILITQKANAAQFPKQLYDRNKYKYENCQYWQKMGDGCWGIMNGCIRTIHSNMSLLMEKYANAIIYPTTELEQYVKRGFKTEDDVKFKMQQCATKRSIWVAIIIGLASLIATYVSTNAPITLNETQYNHIVESVKTKTEPKIVDAHIVNDTLDVNIKQSVRLNTRSHTHTLNIPTP